jgi:hypothetical protein
MKFRGSLFLGQISVESFPGIRYSFIELAFANCDNSGYISAYISLYVSTDKMA